MQQGFVQRVEDAALAVAESLFGELARREGELARAILAISDAYNLAGGAAHIARRPPELLARLLFFTLADLCKVAFPLAELMHRELIANRPLRVLDVGAGCGALSLGALGQLGSVERPRSLQVHAIDINGDCLALMEAVAAQLVPAERFGGMIALTTECHDLRRPLQSHGHYDLILAGNVLAELPAIEHLPLARRLLELLDPAGALIVIEPALRDTARALHGLRDALLRDELAHVFAPCTQRGPCPALLDPKDWCHESRGWEPPDNLRRLINATGLRRRQLKWSYLTLRRQADNVGPDAWRAVSSVMRSKGKREVFVCGASGRSRAVLLDRHRAPHNERFRALDRGQLVRFGDLEAAPIIRVDASTTVTTEDPAC